ncbi:MAG TPA: tetratricopeptide repeat protein [Vicinamibacterales bacterium]|nr:tetratricopeptide repeat protein [Vicinamibacterales bacterium]
MSRFTLVVALAIVSVVVACHPGASNTKEEYVARGNAYAAERKYREAIVEYLNAVRLDPKFGTAHARLADAYFRSDESRLALREYVTAADLLGTDLEAQLNAAQALLMAGSYQDAQGRAEKALAIDPKNATGQLIKANARAGLKDSDGAITELQELVAAHPNDANAFTTLAGMQAAKGDDQAAESAFKRAVELDAKSPVPLVALANFYWSKGRKADVEATLQRAREIAPADPRVQNALAAFYLSTGRDKDAEAPLRAMDASTKSASARISLADYYLRVKRNDDAIKLLRELSASDAGFGPATLRLAKIDYDNQRTVDAHRKIDEVLAKEPKNADALMLKASYLRRERKFDEALGPATAAAAIDRRTGEPQYLVGLIRVDRHEPDAAIAVINESIALNPRHIPAKLALASLQLGNGKPAVAVALAREVLAATPTDLKARLLLARGQLAQGDLTGAEQSLRGMAETQGGNSEVHTLLGTVAMANGNLAVARREFDRALELNPANTEARQSRVMLDASKNPGAARTLVAGELEKSPNDPRLLRTMAAAYAAEGNVNEEEKTLRRLIDVDPRNLEAFGALAGLYMRTNRLDQARGSFESIIRQRPKDAVAHTMLGEILQVQQKHAEAQKVYEAVMGKPEDAPIAANNLAWLYAENGGGTLDRALELAQAAKRQLPNSPEVDDTLGWIYYKKNLGDLAVPPLEESVKRDPKNANHLYHLGLAYQKVGDIPKALNAFETALKLKPDFKEAAEKRSAIRGR